MSARHPRTPVSRTQNGPERVAGRLRGSRGADGAPEGATALSGPLRALSEREFQRSVRGTLEALGFVVWVVPNMKLTTAGLPDLVAWHARLPGLLLALELKRERDARITPAQKAALAHLATVPGVEARILRPSGWERLRDTLAMMLTLAPADARGQEG